MKQVTVKIGNIDTVVTVVDSKSKKQILTANDIEMDTRAEKAVQAAFKSLEQEDTDNIAAKAADKIENYLNDYNIETIDITFDIEEKINESEIEISPLSL